jgi:uncharacterized protein (TIRG00374 family)
VSAPASRRGFRTLLGITFTVVLLAWALRGVSPGAVWDAVRDANWAWIGLGLVAFLASFAVRAWRWGTLLSSHGTASNFSIRHSAIYIGFAGNCVLPAHAGEIARAGAIHRFGGVPFGTAVGSIFCERLLDALAVFTFLLLPVAAGALQPETRERLEVLHLSWMGVALATVVLAFLAAARWPQHIAYLVGRTVRLVGLRTIEKRVVAIVRSVLDGLEALRQPARGAVAVLQSFAIWGLTGLTYWAVLLAYGITSPGFLGGLLVQSVAALGIALPSTPGYFGPYEAAIRLALDAYRIPSDAIVAYALTVHLLIYVSVTTIGFALAARLGLSWGDYRVRGADQVTPERHEPAPAETPV